MLLTPFQRVACFHVVGEAIFVVMFGTAIGNLKSIVLAHRAHIGGLCFLVALARLLMELLGKLNSIQFPSLFSRDYMETLANGKAFLFPPILSRASFELFRIGKQRVTSFFSGNI